MTDFDREANEKLGSFVRVWTDFGTCIDAREDFMDLLEKKMAVDDDEFIVMTTVAGDTYAVKRGEIIGMSTNTPLSRETYYRIAKIWRDVFPQFGPDRPDEGDEWKRGL